MAAKQKLGPGRHHGTGGQWVRIFCFLLLLVFLVGPVHDLRVAAATPGVSLEAAIAWGLEHSPTLLANKEEVVQIKRQLAKLETNLHWQAGLTGGVTKGKTSGEPLPAPASSSGEQVEVGIQGSKVFRSGLSLTPKITLKKELSTADQSKVGFTFRIDQPLFPWVPPKAEQDYYTTLNKLKKAEDQLTWQVTQAKIEWLEGYLNLLRLHEQLMVAEAEYTLAVDDLTRTKQRQQIGEASRQQVLAAEVGRKNAEYQYKQAANRFGEAERNWRLALGLPADYQIKLEEDSSYLRELQEEVGSLEITGEDPAMLLTKVEATHYQLAAKRLDQTQLQQEWAWKQGDYQPEVTTGGTYDASDQSWTFNLNVAYQFWDGGAKRLDREDHQARLAALDREYQNLLATLENELCTKLSAIELAQLQVEEKRLALEKVNLETEIYAKQLAAGLLTKNDWQLKQLEQEKAVIGFQSAEDQVFLSKLRVLHFLGMI